MAVKPGDTVRYLNAVGGGRVIRIADGIAYVDEDGFETPVLVRECVVVTNGAAFAGITVPDNVSEKADKAPKKIKEETRHTELESSAQARALENIKPDNLLNVVLGFEPENIKALSQSGFDAYIVNDSNFFIYVCVSSRSNDDHEWQLRYDGLIEPNMQEFAFELPNSDLPHFDRLKIQYIAFKRSHSFETKAPGSVEFKLDNTKFAKLHCFRHNPYFDGPVIAYDIVVNDSAAEPLDFSAISGHLSEKKTPVKSEDFKPKSSSRTTGNTYGRQSSDDPIVVDLHASELLDTTAGLSPADILNLQIDRFSEVMDENLKYPGRRIIFIHGKGEGVLRQALMKELNHRYKGHDVQDASFREYGFGATQVTIRQNAAPTPQRHTESRIPRRRR